MNRNPRSRRPRVLLVLGLLLVAAAAAVAYWWTRPRIVFLGFPSMFRLLLAEASAATGIRYDYWTAERLDDPSLDSPDFRRYRVIYLSARRSDPLPRPVKQALDEALASGSRVIVIPPHHAERLGVGTSRLEGREAWLGDYWQYGGPENMTRFFHATAALYLGDDTPIEEPVPTPDDGYYHPDAASAFTTTDDYLAWYRQSGHYKEEGPRVLVDFADGWKLGMTQGTDALIRSFEDKGVNVGTIFGVGMAGPFALEFRPDLIVSRKHGRWWLGEPGVELLRDKVNVPVMRGLSLLFTGETFSQYRQTRNGIRGAGLAMGAIVPELDGAIEPTLIEGLDAEWYGRRYEAINEERIERLTERALRWIHLRQLPTSKKRIAIVYVAGIGKGKITAANLNLPRSLVGFLHAMKADGYSVSRLPTDEKALLEEMLAKGRNISAGQAGDLRELADREDTVLLPVEDYARWFEALPERMWAEVTATFGPPPGDLMTIEREGKTYFIIPKLDFGNVLVLPQPVRGAKMDAKLQHNDRVPPPHQYLAVYWWLREQWKADALLNYGTHGTHEFLPGRPLGQLDDDWSDCVLGSLPNIYVYTMDNVGEALIAKRRGSAVTVSHQIPPIVAARLSRQDSQVEELYRAAEQFLSQEPGALKERLRQQIARQAHEQGFDRDLGFDWERNDLSDEQIRELHLHIHLINEDRIPSGLHVHGRANNVEELAPLITYILGQPYLERVARKSGGLDRPGSDREKSQDRAVELIRVALQGKQTGPALSEYLEQVLQLKKALEATSQEIPRTLHALGGGYIPPGGGGDPVRNPQALPTGRNLYGVNPAEVPTRAAWEIGVQLATELLEAEQQRLGRWPRKVGFTLWNTEIIRQYGTDLAQILYLLGVRPVWDHRSIVADVELIPAAVLGRPRIDIVIQAASLFRDTFPDRMELLDRAVRLAAGASDGENFIAENTAKAEQRLLRSGLSLHDARRLAAARVFSNAPGGYGTGLVAGIERSGTYSDTKNLTEAYLARTGAVYTKGGEWGRFVPGLYEQALSDTDAVALSRSTNVVSPLTLDHYFEYLGGMTMAVRDTTGASPETYVADVRDAHDPRMETLQETLTRDLRGKFWNPRWIAGQQQENFSGAVEIAQTATNLYGWQVTKPEAVEEHMWQRVYEVYVKDSLQLTLPEWFDEHNPYAFQNLTSVLLESARKGFWNPSDEVLHTVANGYARSVAAHGPAGDIRTVENTALEEFVYERLHAPGNAPGLQLTSLYTEALDAGKGSSSEKRFVSGRKLVAEEDRSDEEASVGNPTQITAALLVLAGAFFFGVRHRRSVGLQTCRLPSRQGPVPPE